MTVAQLIEHLKREDPDKVVVGYPITYPIPEGSRITFDVTWIPAKNGLRNMLQIHVPGEPAYKDIAVTFI